MTGEADRVINAIKLIVKDEMERITELHLLTPTAVFALIAGVPDTHIQGRLP